MTTHPTQLPRLCREWTAEEIAERERLITESDARSRRNHLARLQEAVFTQLGARYAPGCCSLDSYQITHPECGQAKVVEQVRAMVERLPASVAGGENLLVIGPCGTGKDHLLASLLYQATGRHGLSCRYTTGPRIFSRFRSAMHLKDTTEDVVLESEFIRPAVLAISDPVLANTPPTDWEMARLYAIIDGRYREAKPTWITLNAVEEKQPRKLLTSPIHDRLREKAMTLWCKWPSHRGA